MHKLTQYSGSDFTETGGGEVRSTFSGPPFRGPQKFYVALVRETAANKLGSKTDTMLNAEISIKYFNNYLGHTFIICMMSLHFLTIRIYYIIRILRQIKYSSGFLKPR